MGATYCGQCGKPTPADSIHTCSPQQRREWVTYEVQYRPNRRSRMWRRWDAALNELAARRIMARSGRVYPNLQFRAVRIRHTEEVIG